MQHFCSGGERQEGFRALPTLRKVNFGFGSAGWENPSGGRKNGTIVGKVSLDREGSFDEEKRRDAFSVKSTLGGGGGTKLEKKAAMSVERRRRKRQDDQEIKFVE